MISNSCSSTGSVRRRHLWRPLHAPFFMSHRPMSSPRTVDNAVRSRAASSSPDPKRSSCRRRGVLVNRPAITSFDHRTSTTSARVVSCVTGPVFTGRATQPKHRITGPATQPETGHLTQLGRVGESDFLAFPREFFQPASSSTNCKDRQTFTTKRRSESPCV